MGAGTMALNTNTTPLQFPGDCHSTPCPYHAKPCLALPGCFMPPHLPFWRELLRHIEGADAASQNAAAGPAAAGSLEAALHALAAAEAEAAGDNSLSASQQVWQPRGAPPAASLAELAREPQLLPGLQACADAAGAGVAEAAAAAVAAGVARALLASDPARAAVQAAAASGSDAEGGGSGLVQQLEALAAAQQA